MNEFDGEEDRLAQPQAGRREPAFNLPPLVVWFSVAIIAIHAVRRWVLSVEQDVWTIVMFAFIPARYAGQGQQLPGFAAEWWSPFTYSLLHADWTHVLVNLVWLAAFGSPVASRLGAGRAFLLGAIASAGGAALHYLFHPGELTPVIGASAVVSGYMGAASRFAFQPGPAGMLNVGGPALSLAQGFSNPRFLAFLGVWFALNFLFGSGIVPIAGEETQIAWQAHVGGFLGGLLAFSLVDRRR